MKRPALDDGEAVKDSLATEGATRSSRKNTRLHCKGKPGRPHQTAIRIPDWLTGLYGRTGREVPACGWREPFRLEHQYYECHHEVYCTVCGKILTISAGVTDCPQIKAHGGSA